MNINRTQELPLAMIAAFAAAVFASLAQAAKPNIVVVLCDDLGYGDVRCLNPQRCKIQTPRMDTFAGAGMVFTDAHSGSSVCTPTRYGLLTGRYSWRSKLQSGVVQGFEPCLIAADRPTVAGFLRLQGYHTAIVGKWHLNFEYQDAASGDTLQRSAKDGLPSVGSKIPDGPISRGFDYFHGFHHARDMKAVIENDAVIAHDDEINMLPRLTRKAIEYINDRANSASDQPFFLYVPLGSPHTPILPSQKWQGKSGISPYADFVMQTDAAFGEILDAIDQNGLEKRTLVIFCSDNGCSKAADLKQLQEHGHYPSANLRGSKADIWEGGHRVPFIVRWPSVVASGSKCDRTICLTDLFATCANLMGETIPDGSAEDSVSFFPALKGEPIVSTRAGVIHHSINGHFAYRSGKWKLCLARASGGWSQPTEKDLPKGSPEAQLYDLEADPAETTNLYSLHPEIAAKLLNQLEADVQRGRSTEGKTAINDLNNIKLWKSR